MSSPENYGPQFKDYVLLHRGIKHVHPGVVSSSGMGVHWSHNPDVARSFADWWSEGNQDYPEDNQGVVVSGLVHKDDIIEPYSDEWHEAQHWGNAMNNEIYDPEHSEQEATVRPGAKVHVVSLEHEKEVSRTLEGDINTKRLRKTYSNPRIGEA